MATFMKVSRSRRLYVSLPAKRHMRRSVRIVSVRPGYTRQPDRSCS